MAGPPRAFDRPHSLAPAPSWLRKSETELHSPTPSSQFLPLGNNRFQVIPIHSRNISDRDLLRAHCFAFSFVRAAAKTFGVHLLDHPDDTAAAFRFALGQQPKVGDLR